MKEKVAVVGMPTTDAVMIVPSSLEVEEPVAFHPELPTPPKDERVAVVNDRTVLVLVI